MAGTMRITIVVGGRWHAFDLAHELNKQGHLFRLITNYPTWFVKKWGIPHEKIVSLPLTFWVVKAIYKLGGESLMMHCQWRVHQWFAKRAAKYLSGSECIHGWSQWSEPSFQWAKTRGIPIVLERSSAHILEQSRLLHEEHQRLGLKWTETHAKIEKMELREYELCDSVAVPSLFVERSFIKRHFRREKLFRNALGVNLSSFKPATKAPPAPSDDGLRIIYAGSLSVRKGLADLLEAFALASLPKATLKLLGGETPELKLLLREQPPQVKILGHIPQEALVGHYQQSHCFVLASVEEGMAMVQMQALACGLPLICTTNTGGEDLLRMTGSEGKPLELGIKQFPAGFLVPIHSPAAISSCLRKIANEETLWISMHNEAINLASNQLSWESYGQRAIEHYKDLIEARK
ncbi:Glycosyltransferase [Synechococcus sp. RCC307]|nr:Glycosyltransferase [Synechococcus sp. RCC307]